MMDDKVTFIGAAGQEREIDVRVREISSLTIILQVLVTLARRPAL